MESYYISTVRECLIQRVTGDKDVDEVDIARIQKTDDLIRRFIMIDNNGNWINGEMNVDEVATRIMKTLHWKKASKINHMRASDFPADFYKWKLYSYHLTEDQLIVYVKVDRFINISSGWRQAVLDKVLSWWDRLVNRLAEERGNGICDLKPILIFDVSGMGYANIDMKMTISLIQIVFTHYPKMVERIWVWGLSRFYYYLFKIATKVLPSYAHQIIQMMDLETAIRELGIEHVPTILGGEMEAEFVQLETIDDGPSLEEFAKRYTISDRDVEKLKQHLERLFENE